MPRSHSLILLAFASLVMLIALFFVSDAFWNLRWFDSLMHALGAFGGGLFALWVWWCSGLFGRSVPSRKEAFVAALIFSMVAGVGWEFFELVNGIAHPIGSYGLDTFYDVVSDFGGAVAAGLIGGYSHWYV